MIDLILSKISSCRTAALNVCEELLKPRGTQQNEPVKVTMSEPVRTCPRLHCPSLLLDPLNGGLSEGPSYFTCQPQAAEKEVGREEEQKAHRDVDPHGFCCERDPRRTHFHCFLSGTAINVGIQEIVIRLMMFPHRKATLKLGIGSQP